MSLLPAHRLRLIVITDDALAAPRSIVDVVRAAVEAGAPAIQLRAKGTTAREMAELGRRLRAVTTEAGALFFVNDRYDVAVAVDADGVHVGPDDVPVAALRSVAPPGFLIGTSTDRPAEAERLVAEGADYIGCGTVYPTSTKRDAGDTIGLGGLQAVVDAVPVPVVGIGGIDPERAAEVAAGTSAGGVAVVGAVMGADDPGAVVRQLTAAFDRRR